MTATGMAPRPKGNPILGNLLQFRRDPLSLFTQAQADHGDLIRLRLAHTTAHVLCHPAMAEQALITDTDSIVKYSQIKPNRGLSLLLGQGLIMSSGDLWRRQRSLINPLFRPRNIEGFANTMLACADELVAHLDEKVAQGGQIDISGEMTKAAMQVGLGTMCTASVRDDSEQVAEAITVALRYSFESLKNPLLPPLNWPTKRNRRFHRAIAQIDNYINGLVHERIASGAKKNDLLGLFLDATYPDTGEHMSAQLVRDEAATMLGAGHETSATALTWALVQLARSPRIARRIRAELAQCVGDGPLRYEHLRKLRYLQAVVQETLRLYPPVPIVPRAIARETAINGCLLPRDSMVFISVYNIHRHSDFWPNATEFDPDRFLIESAGAQRHRCAYIPFGAGERFCIGSNFASVELQILLARIVATFDLHIVDEEPIVSEVAVTMRPKNPVFMELERVNSTVAARFFG